MTTELQPSSGKNRVDMGPPHNFLANTSDQSAAACFWQARPNPGLLVEDLANGTMPLEGDRSHAGNTPDSPDYRKSQNVKTSCRMNMGNAMDPRVAIGLEPKNLVMGAL